MAATSIPPAPTQAIARETLVAPAVARIPFTRAQLGTVVALAIIHVVLAIVMRAIPAIATTHALLCGVAGVIFAATTRRIPNIAIVVAYISGCEVLWRMTKADVFWEFGKYAVAAVLVIGIGRIKVRRSRALALTYFLLLLPSAILTFARLDLDSARQAISFNLSGPLALALAVLFFSNIRLTSNQVAATFFGLIIPVLGVAALSLLSTARSSNVEFVNAANSITSGGFGPNQVSAVLGLAVMFVLLFIITRRLPWMIRLPLFILAAILAAQSALTFARGGLIAALAGTVAAMFFVVRGSRRGRMTVLIVGLSSIAITKFVIEPRLDDITHGAIEERYSSTKSSGRDLFVEAELELFAESPLLGVGPGVGMQLRKERGQFFGASHTEYSRMLAEHGLLGILSMLCLLALGIRAIRQARQPVVRGLAAAMTLWVALFLAVYGTRLAAPAFVFGLAFVRPPSERS